MGQLCRKELYLQHVAFAWGGFEGLFGQRGELRVEDTSTLYWSRTGIGKRNGESDMR